MFLIDKYRPTNKKDLCFHQDISNMLEIMSKDDGLPHLIFFGPEGSG